MKKAADQVTSDASDVDLRESSAGGDLPAGSPLEAFRVFLKLGVSSFGGPIAHIGYFREKFVVRRRWLSEQTFVDLVALCQFLPGPASSQTGFAIGLIRAGYGGALAAWAGFKDGSTRAIIVTAPTGRPLASPVRFRRPIERLEPANFDAVHLRNFQHSAKGAARRSVVWRLSAGLRLLLTELSENYFSGRVATALGRASKRSLHDATTAGG
jgi:hypothetical protein